MSATLSAKAAEKAILDFGRPRFGSEIPRVKEAPKNKSKFYLSVGILLLFWSWSLWSWSLNRVEGWVFDDGEDARNFEMVFLSDSGRRYRCSSDKFGKFTIFIPEGVYRVYDSEEKRISPCVLKCSSASNFRVVFGKH